MGRERIKLSCLPFFFGELPCNYWATLTTPFNVRFSRVGSFPFFREVGRKEGLAQSVSTKKPASWWLKTQDNPSKLWAVQWDNLKCKCDILLHGKLTRHDCRLSLSLQSHSKSHSFSLLSSNAMTIDNHQEPSSNKYQIKPFPYTEVTYALNYLLFILLRIVLL